MKMAGGISKIDHSRLHKRLIKKHGNAQRCESEDCKSVNPKRYEWALKKGHQYSDNPDDYLQLCPSCHRKYDYTEGHKEKLKAAKRGDLHNTAKLKNEQVLEIKELILSGLSNKEIAERYGVSSTAICNIKTGKRWGYLTGFTRQLFLKSKP